jgi:ribosomal protein S12 methylthiotransferase accessory factor
MSVETLESDRGLNALPHDQPQHLRSLEDRGGRFRERTGSAPICIQKRAYAMKKGYLAGTHRARSPAETLTDYLRFAAQMGITRLANLTGLDHIGVPVFTAIRPNARSLATSQGKGLDEDSARVSALMESIEVWHAEHIRLPLYQDSYLALCNTTSVIDITALPHWEGSPPRLDVPLLWIEGYNLLQQRTTWVPHDSVTANSVRPPGFSPTFLRSSNGLASGNHLLEAIVHGLCEVIERDAEFLWRVSDDFRLLDLDTVDDPGCREVIERVERAGVRVAAWDMTSDLGIPAYGALLLAGPNQPSGRDLGIHYGFGCHLSGGIALLRALTEAAQTRVTYIAGSRDDFFRHDYEQSTDESLLAGIEAELDATPARQDFTQRPSLASDSFQQDLATLLEALTRVGIDSAVVVDLTRPEIGIPVVKVVVPGLEGPFECECSRGKRALARMKETA